MDASVLVIEKYDPLRDALRNWLKSIFPMCSVSEAQTVAEAIALGQQEDPAVILMNGASPKAGEAHATRELRHAFPDKALIVLTTHETAGFHETILEAGATVCVPTWEITEKVPELLIELVEKPQEKETTSTEVKVPVM